MIKHRSIANHPPMIRRLPDCLPRWTRALTQSVLLLLCFLPLWTSAAEFITYYHLDAQGSAVAATDETGKVIWREDYQPHGKRQVLEDNGGNRVGYAGGLQEGFGLNYHGARWYDPSIGRFMGVDPAGFREGDAQSFNGYVYANNNPYRFVDPNGRSPRAAWAAGEVFGAAVNYTFEALVGTSLGVAVYDALHNEDGGNDGGNSDPKNNGAKDAGSKDTQRSPDINPGDLAGKTPDQIDKLAKDKGLVAKGPDPKSGKGSYVDPVTGKQRVLCHANCDEPHAHVNDQLGNRLDINGKSVPSESPSAHIPINKP